ncbi:uncharacterized protein LOC128558879 [Mercenaria mercenaria]|uniref:uncharacterized protein LOC128558879 n=1 Tax=Mercenaria mercenaria TaxID=6596 RepID=UPI00234E5EAE|nr:uncharacterized protein LOC128558879 [Mercenaria mercenaria]
MASITESDEVVEMFCEICDRKGKRDVIAVGFCVACVTYYCDTCLDYHAQFLPDHIQQDRNQMPKDFYLEKCEQHSKELVKFYCQSCGNIACSVCKNTFHRACQRVCHLSKLACQFELGEEFHIVDDLLNSVETEADTSIEMMRVNMKQNIKHAKAALLEQKKVILTLFDDFEKEINKHENDFKSDVEKEMKKLDQIKRNIQTIKSDIDNKKLAAERCKLFLATKAAERQIKHIKECLNAAKPFVESTNVTKYTYEPTKKEIGPADLGKVIILNRHQTSVSYPETSSFISADKQRTVFRDSSASSDNKSSTQTVNSSRSGEHHSSDNVSLVTVKTQICSDRIETENPEKQRVNEILKLLPLKNTVSPGVVKLNDNMLAMVFPFGQIRFVEVSVSSIKNLKLEYIKTLAIESNTVFRLTIKGILKASYKHKRLIGPTGMTFDTAGNIYVTGFHSHNVFMIDADLTDGYEYFNKDDGLNHPSSIAYDKIEKTLSMSNYVGGRKQPSFGSSQGASPEKGAISSDVRESPANEMFQSLKILLEIKIIAVTLAAMWENMLKLVDFVMTARNISVMRAFLAILRASCQNITPLLTKT